MRFANGWVKIHRSIFTSDIANDPRAQWIFINLIMWANYEDRPFKQTIIPRGSLVTGLPELVKATGISKSCIQRKLKLLEQWDMIGTLVRRKWDVSGTRMGQYGTIITIRNYEKYQCINNEPETPVGRQWDANETPVGQSGERTKELKNLRTKEFKKINSCVSPDGDEPVSSGKKNPKPEITDPEILAIATDWFTFAKEEQPWRKEGGAFTLQAFAQSITKVGLATDLNLIGLTSLLAFIKGDEFWRKNAISPNGLLTMGKNGSRKVDNILSRMKPPGPKEDPLDKWARETQAAIDRGEYVHKRTVF